MPRVVPYGLRPDWFIVNDRIARDLAHVPGLRHDNRRDLWIVHRSHLPLINDVEIVDDAAHPPPPLCAFEDPSTKLRPYQEEGVEFIRTRRGTLLADGMRVGKTGQAVAAHDPDSGPLVVVGPLPVRSVWLDWFRRRWGDRPVATLTGRTYDADSYSDVDLIFAHYDILQSWASVGLTRRIGTLVFDEGHALANKNSNRTQAALTLSATAERVIVATGTPLWNRGAGLWPILTIVNQGGAWGSYAEFTARYFQGSPGAYGWTTGDPDPNTVGEFRARLREVMLRRRWEDIAEDLPPITRTIETVSLSHREEMEIEKLAAQIREDLAKGADLSDDTVAGNLARIRRVVATRKTPVAADLALRCLGEGQPVVVWVWHRDVAEKIASMIRKRKQRAYIMTGDYTHAERDRALVEWRADAFAALVVSMAVAPAGLDFSHAAHCVVAELDWTPATIAQAVMRTYSPHRPNFETYVMAEHDVESRLLGAIVDKSSTARTIGVPAADAVGDISEALFQGTAHEVDLADLARRMSERIQREPRVEHSPSTQSGFSGQEDRGDVDDATSRLVRELYSNADHSDGVGSLAGRLLAAVRPEVRRQDRDVRVDPRRDRPSDSRPRETPTEVRTRRMKEQIYVTVEVDRVLVETPRALLVEIDGSQHWIPKAEIRDDSEVTREGDSGDLVIPEWLADDRGIE